MVRVALVAALAALVLPLGAHAATQTLVFRSAPIAVGSYGVAASYQLVDHPNVDGYVVGMKADLVDGAGNAVPDTDVMLHHVVFAKLRASDYTCPGSCIAGVGSTLPQVGSDRKSLAPQVVSARSRLIPPPWMCPPPAMRRPLSGIRKSAERE